MFDMWWVMSRFVTSVVSMDGFIFAFYVPGWAIIEDNGVLRCGTTPHRCNLVPMPSARGTFIHEFCKHIYWYRCSEQQILLRSWYFSVLLSIYEPWAVTESTTSINISSYSVTPSSGWYQKQFGVVSCHYLIPRWALTCLDNLPCHRVRDDWRAGGEARSQIT